MPLPRVLMLCHDTIQPFSGGGATLSSLFSSFPPENLFSIHNDIHAPPASRVGEHYRLNGHDLRYAQPLESVRRLLRAARRSGGRGAQGDGETGQGRNPSGTNHTSLREVLAQRQYYQLPRHVMKAIRDFGPTLLYGWVGDAVSARTLRRLVRRLGLPYVVHFMDNHVDIEQEGGWRVTARTAPYRRELARVVQGATATLAITEAMARAYSVRWNRTFLAFHAVMPTAAWPRPCPRQENPLFQLAFTGSVERGQLLALLDVARAGERLVERGLPVELRLYLTDYYRNRVGDRFAEFRHVVIHPHPDAHGLRAALAGADALILAYAFDRLTTDYYRYSFPTKLVPYMLSGSPIIAYGPPGIFPIDYVSQGGWASVTKEPSVDQLAADIAELIRDPRRRTKLALLAHEAAFSEHDQAVVAPRFAEVLAAAAQRGTVSSACAGSTAR